MIRPQRRIRLRPRGSFELRLPPEERELLASLPRQLAETLGQLDPASTVPESLRRLFPIAYPRDDAAQDAYTALTRAELAEHHRDALRTLEQTSAASELSEDELQGWLAALNDLRLVLGVALDVTEDPEMTDADDPRFSEWLCYRYLSFLQGEVVDALAQVLPPKRPGADDEAPDDPWGEPPGGLRWDGTPVPEDP